MIEGIDRSGKTTQKDKVVAALSEIGFSVEGCSFPTRTSEIGKLLEKYLQGEVELCSEAAHLIFSADRWQMQETIREKLEAGVTIICDRYVDSGLAYSEANGLDFDWCYESQKGLICPDLTIYLDIDPLFATATRPRDPQATERNEDDLEFQRKAHDNFQDMNKNNHAWVKLDASLSQEVLTRTIICHICKTLLAVQEDEEEIDTF